MLRSLLIALCVWLAADKAFSQRAAALPKTNSVLGTTFIEILNTNGLGTSVAATDQAGHALISVSNFLASAMTNTTALFSTLRVGIGGAYLDVDSGTLTFSTGTAIEDEGGASLLLQNIKVLTNVIVTTGATNRAVLTAGQLRLVADQSDVASSLLYLQAGNSSSNIWQFVYGETGEEVENDYAKGSLWLSGAGDLSVRYGNGVSDWGTLLYMPQDFAASSLGGDWYTVTTANGHLVVNNTLTAGAASASNRVALVVNTPADVRTTNVMEVRTNNVLVFSVGSNGVAKAANGMSVGAGASFSKIDATRATLDFGSVAAQSHADLSVALSGVTTNDHVSVTAPWQQMNTNVVYSAFPSNDTVWVRCVNAGPGATDPPSGRFNLLVHRW